MATYAGRYSEDLQDRYGNGYRNAKVAVQTLAAAPVTLYADRDRTAYVPAAGLAANEIKADSRGNLRFFADPGNYQIVVTPVGGSTLGAFPVSVFPDPLEPDASEGALAAEQAARIAADEALDTVLTQAVTDEATARADADTALSTSVAGKVSKAANGSDFADVAAVRDNLGLGDAATQDAADLPVSTAQGVALGLKASKAGDTFTGAVNVASAAITSRNPDGSGFVVKPLGDGKAGLFNWAHGDDTGNLFHLSTAPGTVFGSAALIAMGIDEGGTGLVIRNKKFGNQMRLTQLSTITAATAIGIVGSQESIAPWAKITLTDPGTLGNVAELISLEAQAASSALGLLISSSIVAGAPTPLRLAFTNANATDKLFRFINSVGTIAEAEAQTGRLVWSQGGIDVMGTNMLGVRENANASAHRAWLSYAASELSLNFRRYSGSPTTHYAWRLITSADLFRIQGAPNATIGSEVWATMLEMRRDRIGFFGTTAVNRKTGWGIASGSATRTTFDTTTVTLPQLAERVKALIDDLHATAGYGLLA